jgi:predicted flap endonuclease-1-like 5' DNA nuclease
VLYTLLKFLGWGLLLAVIGGCIGWMLRALKCRGEVASARSTTVDEDEVERMRHGLANLEQVVAERDRLRMQVADMRHADSPGLVGGGVGLVAGVDEVQRGGPADDAATAEKIDAAGDERDDAPSISVHTDTDTEASVSIAELDLAAAAAVVGKKIKLDDLTAVEGIGPKIAELCQGINVTTWQQLADADVAELQSMLDAAGSRYAVHKPGSWPQQAGLLASGRWAEFKTLIADAGDGR